MLEQLIAQIHDRAAVRLWRMLARIPTIEQQARLQALLVVPAGKRQTPFDRLQEVRAIGVDVLPLAGIPPARLQALSRYALTSRAQALADLTTHHQLATLLAFAHVSATTAQDDALDLLDMVIRIPGGAGDHEWHSQR